MKAVATKMTMTLRGAGRRQIRPQMPTKRLMYASLAPSSNTTLASTKEGRAGTQGLKAYTE